MCRDGSFPHAYLEGNAWRIPVGDVEDYQAQRRVVSLAKAPAAPRGAPDVCAVCGTAPGLVGGRLAMHGPDPDGGFACAGSRYTVAQAVGVAARRRGDQTGDAPSRSARSTA
jgi:hypothetical protein